MVKPDYYSGLIADWYDDWLKNRTDDVFYYTKTFTGFKGRVLELACGTGRILLPIAKQGVSIDGLDSSGDMLDKLRAKTAAAHLDSTVLSMQPMSGFSLPFKYDAIIITSGSFQLLVSDQETKGCLTAVRNHLNPGGFLLMDVFVPWNSIRAIKVDTFTVTRDSKRDDGTRCIVSEKFEVDAIRQVVESVFRYDLFNNGELIQSMIGDFPLRWYWKDEIGNLLLRSGFESVTFLSDSSLYKEGASYVIKAK
jgi:SAM-dependent methyltransferase